MRAGGHRGERAGRAAAPAAKRHVIVGRHGTPLAVALAGGIRHDVTQLIPFVDAVPCIRGRHGRPRHKPKCLSADRGYGFRITGPVRRIMSARAVERELWRQ
ncbi:transposase [Streptomyces chrestomyceticus]|uniref:transposase n=1 Tax=Streptomyces chrestomyceticus TaxID=68185 RepID=UPI003F4D34FC